MNILFALVFFLGAYYALGQSLGWFPIKDAHELAKTIVVLAAGSGVRCLTNAYNEWKRG